VEWADAAATQWAAGERVCGFAAPLLDLGFNPVAGRLQALEIFLPLQPDAKTALEIPTAGLTGPKTTAPAMASAAASKRSSSTTRMYFPPSPVIVSRSPKGEAIDGAGGLQQHLRGEAREIYTSG
jgi:hypothetical protein